MHFQEMNAIYEKLVSSLDQNLTLPEYRIDFEHAPSFSPITIASKIEGALDNALGSLNLISEQQNQIGTAVFNAKNKTKAYEKEDNAVPENNRDYYDDYLEILKAAIRIELFRECQLKNEITKEYEVDSSDDNIVADFENLNKKFIGRIEELPRFNELKKKYPELISSMEGKLGDIYNDYKDSISDVQSKNDVLSPADKRQQYQFILTKYQLDCTICLASYQSSNESEQSWRPFIKNLLSLFTLIYSVATIQSFYHRYKHGAYTQYDDVFIKELTNEETLNKPKLSLVKTFFSQESSTEARFNLDTYLLTELAEPSRRYD